MDIKTVLVNIYLNLNKRQNPNFLFLFYLWMIKILRITW